MNEEQIGISLITGFLGSGKTSLVNQIIKKEQGYKFAIIENEFSDLGLDAEIISGIDRKSIVELSNGCICCTKNTELQETLFYLLDSGLYFNYLLIETTGIAEPDSIIQSVVSNPELKKRFYIDTVICLIDSSNFSSDIFIPEAIKQISMADLVILNKIEKTTSEKLKEIENAVAQINPLCSYLKTMHADYGNYTLISNKMFNYNEFETTFGSLILKPHLSSELKNQIQSISIELEGDFIPDKFNIWMEYFLMLNQSNIYRAKGIISFKGNSRRIIFQAVKASFITEEGDFWPSLADKRSRIIFIGNSLKKNEIEENLKLLMVD